MNVTHQRALLAASVAGILAAISAGAGMSSAQAQEEGTGPCYGINKCKGTSDCGGKGHSCSGQNACQGQGSIELDPDDCLRIQGGSLTASTGADAAPQP